MEELKDNLKNFSIYTEAELKKITKHGKTDVIKASAEMALIKRFPAEETLKNIAGYGITDEIAKAAFDALFNASLDPSEETLAWLAEHGKTEEIAETAYYSLPILSGEALEYLADGGGLPDEIEEAVNIAMDNEERLARIAENGKTDEIAEAAFDSLVDPSDKTLERLAEHGKTEKIKDSAENWLKNRVKQNSPY